MVYEFNHIEVVVESPRILASFTPEQIRLITKFANESNFFVDGIIFKKIYPTYGIIFYMMLI